MLCAARLTACADAAGCAGVTTAAL
jgi:hypothetical protein